MWSKKPMPVETFDDAPLPSRSTATSMSVSLVARLTEPLRPPLPDFAGGRAELFAMTLRPRAMETAFCRLNRALLSGAHGIRHIASGFAFELAQIESLHPCGRGIRVCSNNSNPSSGTAPPF